MGRQGLLKPDSFGRGKPAVQRAIEHLGYVQIDTISVVERAHHHLLWSRVSNYQPKILDRLVRERKDFEHWFHAASWLPMRDYRFALPRIEDVQRQSQVVDAVSHCHIYLSSIFKPREAALATS
jgi:uncharacterized protein YcaQ